MKQGNAFKKNEVKIEVMTPKNRNFSHIGKK